MHYAGLDDCLAEALRQVFPQNRPPGSQLKTFPLELPVKYGDWFRTEPPPRRVYVHPYEFNV